MTWTIIGAIVIFSYAFSSKFVGQYTGISETVWQTLMYLVFVLYLEYSAARDLKADRSKVEGAALVRDGTPPIGGVEIGEIRKISGRFWTEGRMFVPALFDLKIVTNDIKGDLALDRRELFKLLDTRLNRWVIDYDTYTIEPGDNGLHIKYAPVGRYAFVSSSWLVFKLLAYIVAPVFVLLNEYAGITFTQLLTLVIPVLMAFVFLRKYGMVTVEIDEKGIKLEEQGGRKQFIEFAGVFSVEKGFFRTRVTMVDGRVLYFPAALHLLPELIEELAELKKD